MSPDGVSPRMRKKKPKAYPIYITHGTGSGPTPLAAFDAALFRAGIANYNLIHLSSVIPTGAKPIIKKVRMNAKRSEFGKRLYVVYASKAETGLGKSAWAGLGWVMTKGGDHRGLFVEHIGENESDVVEQIRLTLDCMTSYRKESFGKMRYKTVGIHCTDEPVCAVVAAVYTVEPWQFDVL